MHGKSIENYESQKTMCLVSKAPFYLVFEQQKSVKTHEFWLSECTPSAGLQVEASCLDEVLSSLNAEKREALVKATLGELAEKMYGKRMA